jgi:DNA-binding protein WhiA
MSESVKKTFASSVKGELTAIKEKRCCKKALANAESFLTENALIERENFVCDECKNAFLRGVFLKCGSVNAPDKSNHLEMKVGSEMNADEMCIFLRETGLEAKVSKRRGKYVVYFKDGDTIFHVLSIMGAQKCAFDVVNTQIEKNIRNNVNRVNNCEMANMQKSANATVRQLDAIRELMDDGKFDTLPEKLLYTATLRRDNPDLSLTDLANAHEPPITKSCVNHRLEKIIKLAFNE